jgi:hypothetical protein
MGDYGRISICCHSAGGGDGVDTPPAEATEIVVAATNAAKIIERMAFPP